MIENKTDGMMITLEQRSATFWRARAARWQNKLRAGRICDINVVLTLCFIARKITTEI